MCSKSEKNELMLSMDLRFLLSNSSPRPKGQVGLGVDFVFPVSQEEEEQQEEPHLREASKSKKCHKKWK